MNISQIFNYFFTDLLIWFLKMFDVFTQEFEYIDWFYKLFREENEILTFSYLLSYPPHTPQKIEFFPPKINFVNKKSLENIRCVLE